MILQNKNGGPNRYILLGEPQIKIVTADEIDTVFKT
jgi:hypothetical protein